MNPALSIYLDLIRFLAAGSVLLWHASLPAFGGAWLTPLGIFGTDAVMAFFVLSGYVIAYTASCKDKDLRTFAINRAARLYSVCVPAIVLTIVADHIGLAADPAIYHAHNPIDPPLVQIGANLLFINELWSNQIPLFSNGPYWSLGYEAPYYAIFACAFFLRGSARIIATGIACLIAGPKILLLMPIWLMGAAAYFMTRRWKMPRTTGWVAFAGSLAALVVYEGVDATMLIEHRLSFALSCYAPGALITLNILGAAAIADDLAPLLRWNALWIKKLAGNTFSIYLYHFPVLLCLAALIHDRSKPATIVVTCGALAACFVLGHFTEKRKHIARTVILTVVRAGAHVFMASRVPAED